MRQIFLDVETQKSFDQVGGYFPDRLGISYVGICVRDGFSGKGKAEGFFEQDLPKLWPILENADVLIGFNIDGFDIETLRPYYSGSVSSWATLDMLERIKESTGHRVSLNAVATQSLGVQKSGSGLDALEFYEKKQFDKIAKYCDMDVAITRDLYDYGRSKGKVKFLNKWNRLIEAAVDFEFKPKKATGTQMTLMGM
ncbi:MAG TPA: ribonuclease H-like domain-containing protein [Candidatus Saccharimonadia bacterium]|nr:ribonuclease H-like domain-containing protein [Candidatus Saccharimonadia bacterium]